MPEMTAMEHAAQIGKLKPVVLTYGYYRQPNGWITVSPITELEELKYRREGWEPLPQYGRVEMATQYAADHPLEALFMRGGAKELCPEQIIDMGLYLDPPLVPTCGQVINQHHKRHGPTCWIGAEPVSFPQLEEKPEGFTCRFCGRTPPFPTEQARDQHESVMHEDEKSDIRTGQTLAESIVQGLKGGQAPAAPVAGQSPYLCGICGEGFTRPAPFLKHVKAHSEGNTDDSQES